MSAKQMLAAEDFARHVQKTNPFTQDRVTQVRTREVDVGSIHEKAFKRLVKRIDETRDASRACGVLLTGVPGIGKSHVLARLFRWANEEGKATVVYLHNILASPERIGRYLLHATVSNLAGHRPAEFAQSELYKLINLAINARLPSAGKGKAKSMAPNLAMRKEVLQTIGHEIDPDQMVMPVFVTYLEQAFGANLAEEAAEARAVGAVQWLSGDTIDPEVAQSIGLRVNGEDGAHIEDDVAVQRTLDVICRLCACAKRPFVLCLDQVDNLAAEPMRALASFLHALIDNGHNLVVVTSGVRDSIERLHRDLVIPAAAYDRIAEQRINLESLSSKEAQAIVVERIDQFCAPFADTKRIAKARTNDPLTPLSSVWWENFSKGEIEFRPRDVIRRARDAWDGEQERLGEVGVDVWLERLGASRTAKKVATKPPPAPEKVLAPIEERIDQLVNLKLTEAKADRELNPTRLPPDADNLASLTLTLLESCVGFPEYTVRKVSRAGKGKNSCYDLWVSEESSSGATATNGLRFFTEDNASSAVNALKRIQKDPSPPTHQLFITDQQRRPLRLAAAGQRVFDELKKNGRFEHLTIRFSDHAQLDALTSVLGAARVGDLDVEREPGVYGPISEEECRASMHRQRVFLQHPLLRELLSEEPQRDADEGPLPNGKAEQIQAFIEGELVFQFGMTAREMATIIISRTSQSDEVHSKIWEMVKVVAGQMHKNDKLYVAAQNDDLFLQLAETTLQKP